MTGQQLVLREQVQEVCARIASPEMAQRIRQALPEGVTVDRFTRVTLTAVQQNPQVVGADRGSLFTSVIRCAQDGLLPDGREAALVIYKDRVQYMPMIGGLRKIAAEHGITIEAFTVHRNDVFEWELGMEPSVTHRPPPLDQDRGDPIGAYAVATDRDGRRYLEVMSRSEIEQVRAVSRAATSQYGPWVNWWGEMARKTVARRLFKSLPLHDISEREQKVLDAADADIELPPAQPQGLLQVPPPLNAAPDTHDDGEVVDAADDGIIDALDEQPPMDVEEEPVMFEAPAAVRKRGAAS